MRKVYDGLCLALGGGGLKVREDREELTCARTAKDVALEIRKARQANLGFVLPHDIQLGAIREGNKGPDAQVHSLVVLNA